MTSPVVNPYIGHAPKRRTYIDLGGRVCTEYYYNLEFGKRKKNTNKYNSSLSLQVYEYAQDTVGPVSLSVPHPPKLKFQV